MENKVFFSVLCLLFLSSAFSACDKLDVNEDKDKDPYGLNELTGNSVVATGSAVDGANINVGSIVYYYIINGGTCMTLKGSVDLSATALGSYTLGFVYGLNENLTIETCEKKVTTKSLENNTFEVSLSNLRGGSSYYYRAFLSINGNNYYGNVKRFTVFTPTADHFVGRYKADHVYYTVNDGKSQTAKFDFTINIKKSGKGLSVEIPNYIFDSSNILSSFDYKTYSANVQDGEIKFKDNNMNIKLYFYHLTDNSGCLFLSQTGTSGGLSIDSSTSSDR